MFVLPESVVKLMQTKSVYNRCAHIFYVLPHECSLFVSGYILDFDSEHTQVIELMKTRAILRTCQESQGYTQLSYKLVRLQAYIQFIDEVSSYLHF